MKSEGRFLRGKSRLIDRENKIYEGKQLNRKLGKVNEEETIIAPVIGEWSLNKKTDNNPNSIIDHLRAQSSLKETRISYPKQAQTPETYQPWERDKERFNLTTSASRRSALETRLGATIKVEAPNFAHPRKSRPEPKVEFPEGAATTDLHDIMRSKYITPTKPLPPLSDPTEESESKFLPLEYFDDLAIAEFSIEELMKDPRAVSQYTEIDGSTSWRPCIVQGFDDSTKYFTIKWDHNGKTKRVTRFNVRFLRENEEKFENRVHAAKRACKIYESTIRFDARIALMKTDELPDLSEKSIQGIIDRLSPELQKEKAKELLDEIKTKYKTMNNQFEFQYEIEHNPLIPNRDEFLMLKKDRPKPRRYGLVTIEINYFKESLKVIQENLLIADPIIRDGIFSIWSHFQATQTTSFVLGDFQKILALEDFVTRQYTHISESTVSFKQGIEGHLNVVFAKLTTKQQKKKKNNNNKNDEKPLVEKKKLETLIHLTQRMMHNVLLDICETTLDMYLDLFVRYFTDEGKTPLFYVDLYFHEEEKHLEYMPTIPTFQDQLLSLLSQFETTVSELPSFKTSANAEPMKIVFQDCIDLIQKDRSILSRHLDKLFGKIQEFIDSHRYLEKYLQQDLDEAVREFDPAQSRSLDEYRSRLNELNEVIEGVKKEMQPTYSIGLFKVMSASFKHSTLFHLNCLKTSYLAYVNKYAVSMLHQLRDEFEVIRLELAKKPGTPESLAAMKKYLAEVSRTKKDREERLAKVSAQFDFFEEYRYDITDTDFQYRYKVAKMPIIIAEKVENAEQILSQERVRMIKELRTNQRKLENDALSISETLTAFIARYCDLDMTPDAVEAINSIEKQLKHLLELQSKYNEHERLFEFEENNCRILAKLVDEFTPLHILWNLANDWLITYNQWMETPFPQIKADTLLQFTNLAIKKATKVKKDLQQQRTLVEKVVIPLSQQIDSFKQQLPLIVKLRHPGIKRVHWDKISDIAGMLVVPTQETSLRDFFEFKLQNHEQKITEIANIAAQEYNIEASLDKMDNQLRTLQFTTVQFRNSGHFILQQIDEIISIIEEQLVTTQSLLASPFIANSKQAAQEKVEFLRQCRTIIDSWISCQKSWLYLQPIFSGTSISNRLGSEASMWAMVNKIWSKTMMLTHNHPDFVGIMQRPDLGDQLDECNSMLEKITLGLNQYLEQKRSAFPRFYFLSNDELVTILSNTHNIEKIGESIPKLFEYIAKINVSKNNNITDIYDPIGETIHFGIQIDTNTLEIEDWLIQLEDEIRQTLKMQLKSAVTTFTKKKREQWIENYSAQVILISNQILWTQQVTNVLRQRKSRGLVLIQQKFIENLETLTNYIKKLKNPLTRQLVSNMLINDVHNRDIVQYLIDNEINDVDSFDWSKQLRYYWEDDMVTVSSINNNYEYTYEYCGNSPRLVITPLTDRCYQTLLAAFKIFLSGAPSGPAGTGKTETIRDCAKALGRACVVYNCSEEVSPELMGQFLCGVGSAGTWACFDEFNRINIEVLSVIAQQIRGIQNAMQNGAESFILDHRQLKLNMNGAICITMNPGYAGRTELPDNLKVLFRPVAMVQPDVNFVTEILLFSGGFNQATVLSRKLVAVFDLCKKMLSNTIHYDWGLRAMKAILSTATTLAKTKKEEDSEAEIILIAIRNCTAPRLISADLPIFDSILKDVFQGVEEKNSVPEDLKDKIVSGFQLMNYLPEEVFIQKAFELYQTINVRHGVMLVGGTMGGKSTAIKVLQKALSTEDNEVSISRINPKAVSIAELYGSFNSATSEWSDGVLSVIIRDALFSQSCSPNWIVLDGPVDSLWVESMNSLLDDNKVLCLPNNERIQLRDNVRVLFEVDSLSQASPATISRCGMVFYDPHNLGWKPLLEEWVTKNSKYPAMTKVIEQEMEAYIPGMIQFMQNDAKTVVNVTPNIAVANVLMMIDCFLPLLDKPSFSHEDLEDVTEIEINGEVYFSKFNQSNSDSVPYIEKDQIEIVFGRIFLFCIVWGFGGYLAEDSRLLFDHFLKNLCEQNKSNFTFPGRLTCFDFYADLSKYSWLNWSDGSTGLSQNGELENHFIPTNESAAALYLSRLLIYNKKNTIIQGPETSKSLILRTLDEHYFKNTETHPHTINMSGCTSAYKMKHFLLQHLHKHQNNYSPLPGESIAYFLDNISSVEPDRFGSQPALEVLRAQLTYGGFYNTDTKSHAEINGTTLLATAGVAGGGRYQIPQRLLRHFFFIHMPKYPKATVSFIFQTLFTARTQKLPITVKEICKPMTLASLEFLEKCSENLLPVPAKPHYTFSLRNLVHVLKGILLVNPQNIKNDTEFIRLWYHEMMREFADRMNTANDRRWVGQQLTDLCPKHFKLQWESISTKNFIMFNNFSDGTQLYKEVLVKQDQVLMNCASMLEDRNRDASNQIDITLFHEAIEHISAISRVLQMYRGHALLVGIKSSWRKSLARLSLHIANIDEYTISIAKTYGVTEWHEDLKKIINKAGTHDEQLGFIIYDSQIVEKQMLEDLSNLILTGEVPNLFEREEFEKIKAELAATELNPDIDFNEVLRKRVNNNLHVIMIVSPYGQTFKDIVLSYQTIKNECVIDWFLPWSQYALESIAQEALGNGSIGSPDVVRSIVNVCVSMHKSVENAGEKFLEENDRFTAITPSNYFSLLKIFHKKLKKKQKITAELTRDYENGVEKIKSTSRLIGEMSEQLDHDIPMLEETKKEAAAMLEELNGKKSEAEESRQSVLKQSEEAEKEAKVADEANKIAQEQLAAAQPILKEAQEAVQKLDKDMLVSIKKLHAPSAGMKDTFDAVCIMFGRLPRKVEGPNGREEDYWPETIQMLNDVQFIKLVTNFNVEKLTRDQIQKLRKYVPKEPSARKEKQRAAMQSFQAVAALYDWVCASYDYWHVYQEILPKKIAADEASKKVKETKRLLTESRQHLEEIENKLKSLQDSVREMQTKEKELSTSVTTTQARLVRAQKLMAGLAGESTRWAEVAEKLKVSSSFILGDTLLISAILVYLGAFSPSYRTKLVSEWKQMLVKEGIKFSDEFSIITSLSNDVTIRDWIIKGLPNDNHSIENSLIITENEQSYPLLIDPQNSGTTWLREYLRGNLMVLHFDQPDFLQCLKSAVSQGINVLIEDIGLTLDSTISPILNREIAKIDDKQHICLGGDYVNFHPNFRLFLSTKYPNPRFSPEICASTLLINFTATPDGLTDLLLNNLIELDKSDLDRKRIQIMESNAENMKKMKNLEADILKIVSCSDGSDILDDDSAIETLNGARKTANTITQQIAASEKTEEKIHQFKKRFMPVAERATILYFAGADFCHIDPMYQFSLNWFVNLFRVAIKNSQKPTDNLQQIAAYNKSIQITFHRYVSQSVFSRHKLLFSVLVAIRILEADKKITMDEISGLLAPHPIPEKSTLKWIKNEKWSILISLKAANPVFKRVTDHIIMNEFVWQKFCELPNPETEPLPYKDGLTVFQRLVLLVHLIPDRAVECMIQFVKEVLGPEFIEPPMLNLQKTLEESNNMEPIILISSPGIDPTEEIRSVAQSMEIEKYFQFYSLGRGRGEGAEELLKVSSEQGFYVVLQNCHLALSWMPRVEYLLNSLNTRRLHPRFRLLLVTMSSPEFPIGLLFRSTKLIYESPRGIKDNVLRLFQGITPEEYSTSQDQIVEKQLIFHLAFFHSVVLERLQYGSMGWNKPYEFNPSDFIISRKQLRSLISESMSDAIPHQALSYLIGELNYGGRVTDEWDRRTLRSLVSRYFNNNIQSSSFNLSESLPSPSFSASLKNTIEHVTKWPNQVSAESCCLSINADTVASRNTAKAILSSLLEIMPQAAIKDPHDGGDEGRIFYINELVGEIPPYFNMYAVRKKVESEDTTMGPVIQHEVALFNQLLEVINESLIELQKGLKGLILIDPEHDEMLRDLIINRVPKRWLEYSYSSILDLRSYLKDLRNRVFHLDNWIRTGTPVVFKLGAFFHPEEFLTALLQRYAREKGVPYDTLKWLTKPLDIASCSSLVEGPSEGVYVDGLVLEGAKWDLSKECLAEAGPNDERNVLPVIHLIPTEKELPYKAEITYECPVFRTQSRGSNPLGPSNYVFSLKLHSGKQQPEHWVRRAVASYLTTD